MESMEIHARFRKPYQEDEDYVVFMGDTYRCACNVELYRDEAAQSHVALRWSARLGTPPLSKVTAMVWGQ